MIIKSIELADFRNYTKLQIDLDDKINILYGDNAQGKTNILESIYLCSTTRSHRMGRDKDMIRFGQDESHIKMMVDKDGSNYRIDMHLKKNKNKGIAVNGIPIKKSSELLGIVNVILFSPEDLNIIKDGPSERRRFIDSELCQLDRMYLYNLTNYNKIIAQRNTVLRDYYYGDKSSDYESMISVYDDQLAVFGAKIIEIRKKFIEQLNTIIASIHRNLTNGKEELTIEYEPDVDKENLAQELLMARDRDIKMKTTTVGPHRDDIRFSVATKIPISSEEDEESKRWKEQRIDIRKYGSQGQQRSAALSLKMSEIEIVRTITKETPILLLDDVLSELDSERQNHLLNSIKGVQTVISCTGLDEFVENRFRMDRIFYVEHGAVTLTDEKKIVELMKNKNRN